MICKGCGQTLATDAEVRMVAQWSFCETCFQQLLARGSTKEVLPGAVLAEEATAAETRCCLCEKTLVEREGQRIGVWCFCEPCFVSLAGPVLAEMDTEIEPMEEAEALEPEEAFTSQPDPRARVTCTGCSRQIPLGGAREAASGYYCPECFLALPGQERHRLSVFSTAGAPITEALSCQCEACGRTLPQERLKEVQGFALCSACLAVDLALALELAREHHRARMETARGADRKGEI